ncbi:MAG: S8 family serine peptidase [Lachnospiraceae bacterium]|nr:S8 family serine peptidase [Lachnospiraceae bacterium]
MNKKWRRVLSLLLVLVMICSQNITGFAAGNDKNSVPTKQIDAETLAELERNSQVELDGTALPMEDVDVEKVNVPKIGEEGNTQLEEHGIAAIGEEQENADKPSFAADDIVRVSIFLEKAGAIDAGYKADAVATSPSAIVYRKSLKMQQSAIQAKIESKTGHKIDVKWNLTLLVNAISANVRYGDLETIASVPGVRSVELENLYEAQRDEVNTSITTKEMIFASNVWAEGYTGAESKIAIIDTGTNQDHISFNDAAFEYSLLKQGKSLRSFDLLTSAKIEAVKDQLNVKDDDAFSSVAVYKNSKIPYAYNYIDHNTTTDHDSDDQGEHGSHVSGIAAANRYVWQDGEFVDAATSVYAIGAAPDAQIVTMKVFGAGGGAYDSDYFAAIEDAIVLGCDSANLSLGSANPGFAFDNSYQAVLDSLVKSGTVVSMSAGNSGSWYDTPLNDNMYGGYLYADDIGWHTGGSPGSFNNSLTVASADNIGMTGMPLVFNDEQKVFYTETSGYGNEPISTLADLGTIEYVAITGYGTDDDFAALKDVLEGKVAICSRGSTSFYQKANAAVANGAIGTIIYNNQDGTISMNLTGYSYTAPAVSITKADGLAILEASEKKTTEGGAEYYTGKLYVSAEMDASIQKDLSEATMSSFSSWGVPGSLTMKPEITAPGGSIYSVNGMTDDGYELMSGTSMAAPQIAGLAGLFGEYYRANSDKFTLGQRTMANSLLMSTALPMKDEYGDYVSILQQGSGLANIAAAIDADSYIIMDQDATASAIDGKVKAELGDDPERTGKYSYSFYLTNTSDQTLTYAINTDIFTQGLTSDGKNLLAGSWTMGLEADVLHVWADTLEDHDVNKDGVSDDKDAQAILDYLAGNADGSALNLEVAELDGIEGITSNDAYELLKWVKATGEAEDDQLVLNAGETKKVTVKIQLSADDMEALDYYFAKGAYVEGFTYVTCITETEDGEMLDVQHSIPILGFYGNWTDPSMFDTTSAVDVLYGTNTKESYLDNTNTNYLTVRYPNTSKDVMYVGNPYTVEDKFPAERLAVNSKTVLKNVYYSLIRNAGTVGTAVLDADGKVLSQGRLSSDVIAAFYYVNGGQWRNYSAMTALLNKSAEKLGVAEGESFSAGLYAVPEYYGLQSNGVLDEEGFAEVVESGKLGEGASIGYTFKVDDTAPVIYAAALSKDGKTLTVAYQDENYVSYLALMDTAGKTVYTAEVPEQSEDGELLYKKFDVSGIEDVNAIIIFAADYAGNETAKLAKLNDGPVTYVVGVNYVLTDTVEPGNEYVIANVDLGDAFTLTSQGTNSYTKGVASLVEKDEENGNYIDGTTITDATVWIAEEGDDGFTLRNKADGGVLGFGSFGGPYVSWANENYADPFVYSDHKLLYAPYASFGYGMAFSSGDFVFTSSTTDIYFYKAIDVEVEIDPDEALLIKVDPEQATLILNAVDEIDLTAVVEPSFLDDRSVDWTSSDENVATVDANGHVVAVGVGNVTITAASHKTPDVTATVEIEVIEGTPVNAYAFGQITVDEEPQFVLYDATDGSATNVGEGWTELLGGGRSGDYIYGIDVDDDYVRFDVTNEFSPELLFAMNTAYAPLDAAAIPYSTVYGTETVKDEEGNETENAISELMAYDVIAAGASGYLQIMQGSSLNYFNLSSLGLMEAIAFVGIGTEESTGNIQYYYYAMNEEGTLYILMITPSLDKEGLDLNLQYGTLGTIEGAGFTLSDNPYAYSMNYLGFNTYEEFGDIGQEGIFLADSDLNAIWFVSTDENSEEYLQAKFVSALKGATNVAALFNNDLDSIASLADEEEADPEKNIKLPASIIEKLTAKISDSAENAVYVDNISVATTSATGSTNAIKTYVPSVKSRALPMDDEVVADDEPETPETPAEEAKGVVVEITADELANNGLYTITYDPEVLTYVGIESALTYKSAKEADGTIKFAFADLEGVAKDEVLATVTFAVPCDDAEIEIVVNEFNTTLTAADPVKVAVEGIGHAYGEPEWTWAEDYSAATAKFVCANDETHVVELEAEITVEKTDEKTICTATVEFEGKTYTDTVEVEKPIATIVSASLTVAERIDANIYVSTPKEAVKAVLTYAKDNSTVEYDFATMTPTEKGYKLVFENIPAKEMTEVISVTIYDAEGKEIALEKQSATGKLNGNSFEFKVVDWANAALSREDMEKYHDLAKALLNYGQTAQLWFNYKTDDLANPEGYFADEMKSVVANPDYDAVFPSEEDRTTIGYKSISLNLEGATEIFLYFDHEVVAKDEQGNAYKVELNGSRYRVVVPNIVAKELNKTFTVIITENGVDYTFKVSALSYANRVLANDTVADTLKDVARALYLLNQAAIKAFN